MDTEIADELLNEFFSAFEASETQSAAILQFLKDKGMASDEELAPYLEQAGNAANVRARAARLRISSLLSSALNKMEQTTAHTVEDTAKKIVAAELEAEKPRRRRRHSAAEKELQGQPDKSQAGKSNEQHAAPSDESTSQTGGSEKKETPKAGAEQNRDAEGKSNVAPHENQQGEGDHQNRASQGGPQHPRAQNPEQKQEAEKKIA